MILTREERKTILEALVYMLKSAYTEEEIRSNAEFKPEIYKNIIEKRKDKLESLKRLIYIFRI